MRMALGVSYAGSAYQGWQSQPSGQTVQDRLETALARFAGMPVNTLCAGRTDAGVHALLQVVHFDCSVQRETSSWVRGVNAWLAQDISVQWALPVPETFHARACAMARRYVYVLLQSPVRPSLEVGRVGWSFRPLDGAAMRDAAQRLIGEHDFSSFRAAQCQALSPVKTVQRIAITRHGAYWRFEFQANAFLHHMIRNIMGCLIMIGHGAKPVEWMQQVLEAKSRETAAPTFSPDGLYFVGPQYDAIWGLPTQAVSLDWLAGSAP